MVTTPARAAVAYARDEPVDHPDSGNQFHLAGPRPRLRARVGLRQVAVGPGVVDDDVDRAARQRASATASAPSSVARSPIAAAAPPPGDDPVDHRAASRPCTTTAAPSAARYSAVAAPSPELEPVTTARLSLKRRSVTGPALQDQAISPVRATNRPDPAPGGSVASPTIASVPSVTVCGPLWPLRSVAV